MASLDRGKCFQSAIATSGITVAALAALCAALRAQQPGAAMNWQSWTFLGLTVFFLLLTLGLVACAIGFERWRSRHWTLLAAAAAGVVAVWVGIRFFRDLTELSLGILFGIGGMLLLEGLRRLGFGYHLRKKMRHESEKAAEEARRVDEEAQRESERTVAAAAAEAQRALVPEDILDRLRGIHSRCKPAFGKVDDLLSMLCSGKQEVGERSQAARLIMSYVVQPLREKSEVLDSYFHVPRPLREAEFIELKTTFRDVISKYIEAGAELGRMGWSHPDDKSLATQKYAELLQSHAACLGALEETVSSIYFRDITASHMALMRTLFPRPG